MQINDIYEAQKRLIEAENVNISETNVLKDFFQIVLKIFLILSAVYISFMLVSGIIIGSLSLENQIKLENYMAKFTTLTYKEPSKAENIRINKIKNEILLIDKKYPRTSNLDVKIYPNSEKNAFCLPNGNIYITSALFNEIKNDEEMLFFIMAHEMAHYKHKDHIMSFRKNIASAIILTLVAVSSSDNNVASIISDTIKFSDLSHSRKAEANADKYAGLLLLKKYGSINGGIKVLNLIAKKDYPKIIYIFSTHPSGEKRIENLKKLQ